MHEKQDMTENCVEAMQFIKPGSHTGKRRILAEQILFVAGAGYDLLDVEFEVDTEFTGRGRKNPASSNGNAATSFVPAYCIQQHFNSVLRTRRGLS